MKDQALQSALLKVKDLEYAKETYLEYQDHSKVCILFVYLFIYIFSVVSDSKIVSLH